MTQGALFDRQRDGYQDDSQPANDEAVYLALVGMRPRYATIRQLAEVTGLSTGQVAGALRRLMVTYGTRRALVRLRESDAPQHAQAWGLVNP